MTKKEKKPLDAATPNDCNSNTSKAIGIMPIYHDKGHEGKKNERYNMICNGFNKLQPMFIFEHKHKNYVWRLQVAYYQNRWIANIKPWWFNEEGELCPTKYGLHISLPILWKLMEAILDAKDAFDRHESYT